MNLVLGVTPLGDVLVGGDPAPARHRLIERLDQAAELGLDRPGRGPALADIAHDLAVVQVRIGIQQSDVPAVLDQLVQRAAGLHHLRRQPVHFEKAAVEHDDLFVGIEHAQALRHVVERGVEAAVALAQLLFGGRSWLGARRPPAAEQAERGGACRQARTGAKDDERPILRTPRGQKNAEHRVANPVVAGDQIAVKSFISR